MIKIQEEEHPQKVVWPFSSFFHHNFHWVFCFGKDGSLPLQVLRGQRHRGVCQSPGPFHTMPGSRRCSQMVIVISHFGTPRTRWSDDPCPFLCPEEQMRTSSFAVTATQSQLLLWANIQHCSRDIVPKCSGSQLPALVINSTVGEAER